MPTGSLGNAGGALRHGVSSASLSRAHSSTTAFCLAAPMESHVVSKLLGPSAIYLPFHSLGIVPTFSGKLRCAKVGHGRRIRYTEHGASCVRAAHDVVTTREARTEAITVKYEKKETQKSSSDISRGMNS
jgi:hypothetical protein